MQPIFTMQYAEFKVADYLANKINGASAFIPASAQEKGIDLLLYKYENSISLTNTIQVKMSRTYYNVSTKYQGSLWFNRFSIPENANWFILVGICAKFPNDSEWTKSAEKQWDTIMLAFTNKEMNRFMDEVKQKRNRDKDDKMFGFSFNDKNSIIQTRGYFEERDMSKHLIENRLEEISLSFR